MKFKEKQRHCIEVDALMNSKLPFITRYGITIVVFVFLLILIILASIEGDHQQIIHAIIDQTMQQIILSIK